jgi:glycosyltransferase involved in cell wall biosynthesis
LKILIVHNEYRQEGGEHAAVIAQIKLLRQHNHELFLDLRDNREIENYGLFQKMFIVPHTIYSTATYKSIAALVAEFRPDVAHVHNVFPLISPAVYRALKDSDVPIVQTLHNYRFLCPNGLFYTRGEVCMRCKFGNTINAVVLKCYRNSYSMSALYALSIGLHRRLGTFQMIDRFIALTGFTTEKMIESGLTTSDKISILGNFLSETLHEPGSFQTRSPYVVYLGRLSPEKGIDTIIRAMSGVPDLELKIAGDGPQDGEIRALSQKLGLTRITFLGKVSGKNKWDLLRNATAAVVPSVWFENFPITILESMAVGTPVVASDIGGLPYIIRNSFNGLLFKPGSPDNLREKLLWISDNPKEVLTMGKNCIKYINDTYSPELHYNNLMEIYGGIIEKKK